MSKNIKFAFFGGEPLSVPTLEKLYGNGLVPALVVCNPDKPAGRNLEITPSPTKVWAEKNGVPYVEDMNKIEGAFDLFVVVAYGKIIPREILDKAKLTLNLHPSLLPKYRGPSPMVTAILNGDIEGGVTIIKLDEEIDHGPILNQAKIELKGDEIIGELENKLAALGGELLVRVISEGEFEGVEQDHSQATFTKKIKKEDGLVDLEKEDAQTLYNKFRAYYGWPSIFFFQNGKRIKITAAALENNPLDPARGKQFIIKKVLPEAKKEITWEEFKRQN